MDKPTQLIPQISPDTKTWVVRVTVIEDIPTITCGNGSPLKRYVLTDDEGNEVIGAVYGRDVRVLCPMIHLYHVYDIANADIRQTPEKFKIVDNLLQWNIRRDTLIRPVPQATPNLTYFLDSLTPFSIIAAANSNQRASNNEKAQTADIIGIVIHADEVRQVNKSQNRVQHFTVIDPEKIRMRISIWDDMIDSQGEILTSAATNNAVLVAKRLTIKSFNCVSLSSKNCSSFAIDPPIEATTTLRAWYNSLSNSEHEELLVDRTVATTRELVRDGRMRTYTLAEVTNNIQAGDYWVRGLLKLPDDEQQFHYVACSNCHTKINAAPRHQYMCFICHQSVVATLRLLVVLTAIDQTSTVQVVAINEIAERILQTTPENMLSLVNLGQSLEISSIKYALEAKSFLMLLRRNFGRNSNTQRRLLLIAAFDESFEASAALPYDGSDSPDSNNNRLKSPTTFKEADIPLSPLKRQMSQIIITPETTAKRKMFPSETSGSACRN